MQVVLADIEEDVLEKTVEELRQYQYRVIGIKTDVLIEESARAFHNKRRIWNIHTYVITQYRANSGTKPIWEVEKGLIG